MSGLNNIATVEGATEPRLSQWLSKPLITGASISGDYAALSPGKHLALRFTDSQNIRTVAQSGQPGAKTIQALNSRDFDGRTIILALDFFFWDSTHASANLSLRALHTLMGEAAQRDLPLVVGNIPALLPPAFQPQRKRLNDEITRCSLITPKFFVMPFNEMHSELMQKGYWLSHGKKLTLREIVPDGLHVGQTASILLADELLSIISRGLK